MSLIESSLKNKRNAELAAEYENLKRQELEANNIRLAEQNAENRVLDEVEQRLLAKQQLPRYEQQGLANTLLAYNSNNTPKDSFNKSFRTSALQNMTDEEINNVYESIRHPLNSSNKKQHLHTE